MGKVLETLKKIDNVLNYHLNGEVNGVMFNDVSLLRKPIGIGTKSYGFLESMLYKNIGSHNFKFDGYSTIIGMNSNPYLTNEFNPWFMTDENRIKYDNYLSYINGVYFCGTMMGPNFSDVSNNVGLLDYSALVEENARVGVMHSYDMSKIMSARSLVSNGATNPNGYDDTRLGVINNFYLSSQLYNAYNEQKEKITSSYNLETIGDGASFSITKGAYTKFGFDGSHGIKNGEWVVNNNGIVHQTVISGDLFDLTESKFGELDLTYSSKFIKHSGEKTKEFIFKSIYGVDLLSSTSVPLFYEEFNKNNSIVGSKKYLPKKNNTYLDVIAESYDVNQYRYDLANVGNYTKDENTNYYYEEKSVNGANYGSKGGTRTNYVQKFTLNDKKKDIIYYTNELFKNNKIKTLIGRHSTGEKYKNDQLSSSVTQYGMSHGRNLLKKNHTNNDPYCRVWTYLKQYQSYKDLIRPFDEELTEDLDKKLIYSNLQINRDLLKDNGVKDGNGLVRFGPKEQKDITKCMFSIENLAYKHEKFDNPNWVEGENGGRIMWFPPYDLNFNENLKANWSSASFVGRGEKIYSYVDSERSGTLAFSMLIDHPSIINAINKQDNTSEEDDNDENKLLRFFAGCDIVNVPVKKKETEPVEEENNSSATPDNEDTINLEFSVYFPNDYSGINHDDAIYYLCNGIGVGCDDYVYYVKEGDNYIDVGGYEMCYDPDKIEVKNTYFVYDNNNKLLGDVYVIIDEKLKCKSNNAGEFSCDFSDANTVFLLKEGYKPIKIDSFDENSFTFKENDENFRKYEVNVVDEEDKPVSNLPITVSSYFDGENIIRYEVPTNDNGEGVILSCCHDSFLEVIKEGKIIAYSYIDITTDNKINLKINNKGMVKFIVKNSFGEAIGGVIIKNKSNNTSCELSNGEYYMSNLTDGELLKVIHPLYIDKDIIYNEKDEKREVTLEPNNSFNLTVKVLDNQGKAIDGVKVTIDGIVVDTGKTDSDGKVLINNISLENVHQGAGGVKNVYVIAEKKGHLTVKEQIIKDCNIISSEIEITLTNQTTIDESVIKINVTNINEYDNFNYDGFKFYIDGKEKKYTLEDDKYILKRVKIPTNVEIQHVLCNTENITIENKDEQQVDVTLKQYCGEMTLNIFSSILKGSFKCENINIAHKNQTQNFETCPITLENILEGDEIVISKEGFEEYIHIITNKDIEAKEVKIDLIPSDKQDVTFYVYNQNKIPLFNCKIKYNGREYSTNRDGCCTINVILGSTVTVASSYFDEIDYPMKKEDIIDGKYDIEIKFDDKISISDLKIFDYENGMTINSGDFAIYYNNMPVNEFNIGDNIMIVSKNYQYETITCYNDVEHTPIMLKPKPENVVKFMMTRNTSNNDGSGENGDGEKDYYGISCSKDPNITTGKTGATVYYNDGKGNFKEVRLENEDYFKNGVEYYAYRRDDERNSTAETINRFDSISYGLNVISNENSGDDNTIYCSFLDIVAAHETDFTENVLMERESLSEILKKKEKQISNIKELFKSHEIKECVVTGYATKDGITEQNKKLIENRAKVIKEWLVGWLDKNKFKVDAESNNINDGTNNCNDKKNKEGRCSKVKISFSKTKSDGETKYTKSLQKNKQQNESQQKKLKEYSEYEFFDYVNQTDNFLRHQIIDKIKYFDPAFHSITPEGFNSRLTFLHQCTRQGPTYSATDSNNKNISNLSFGSPPICVLRIGDFYNTKIVIDSISIDYNDSTWDLNCEGIGVMPMMAAVTINFNFIGGSDLTGPINRLQNAISSNYYANTSVYDKNSITKLNQQKKNK